MPNNFPTPPPGPSAPAPPAPTGPSGAGDTLRFDDPWVTDAHPPPAAGRYVRIRRRAGALSAGPEWYPGWAWTERPEDGWVECGYCPSGAGVVLVGLGPPPAVCFWIPDGWPAHMFPLGDALEHCVGWRDVVRGVIGLGQDSIPPGHPGFGWETYAQATRLLAHHAGVIPTERLTAPLPASREEARRELDPLLDGLVLTRRKPAEPPVVAGMPRRTGRPPDETKRDVIEFVRGLRSSTPKTPWKNIPDAVFEQFKVRYTAETLRGYHKAG